MPLFLGKRAVLVERMDDPSCDPGKLQRTYAQFRHINRLLCGWRRIYQQFIRPAAKGYCRLLDIGFGGGDIPTNIARWASRDGIALEVVAIDADSRALHYVGSRKKPENVSFLHASARDLLAQGERFDFVISNHLLHHLQPDEIRSLCRDAAALSRTLVLHNDIERGDLAYLAFWLTWPFFRNSYITPDGLISIRRAYTRAELAQVVPKGWLVRPMFPYRLLLIHPHD